MLVYMMATYRENINIILLPCRLNNASLSSKLLLISYCHIYSIFICEMSDVSLIEITTEMQCLNCVERKFIGEKRSSEK